MDFKIAGKTALVLSSSGGLGLGIARALAAEGVDVVVTGRSADKLAAAVETINAQGGGSARSVVADLTTAEGLETLGAVAQGVDILINNTGGPPPMGAQAVTAEHWRTQLEAMLVPVTTLTLKALPNMKAKGWGRIVTVASSGVEQPIPNLALSNGLRSAVLGWSKTLAAEVAKDGVTVNLILPGRIHTDRTTQIDSNAAKTSGKSLEEVAAASQAAIPAGRYGRVEEFGAVAAFLCSDGAGYVTGSAIRVDGGLIRSV